MDDHPHDGRGASTGLAIDLGVEPPPDDDSLLDLSAALDAALSPPPPGAARGRTLGPDRPGSHACLRCGHHWTPSPATVRAGGPRCCALCRSTYWSVPPAKPHARRPEDTDWDAERLRLRARYDDAKRRRRLARLADAARELGIKLTDSRTERPLSLAALRRGKVVAQRSTPAPQPIAINTVDPAPAAMSARALVYPPTVPPPPGSEAAS